MCVCVRVCVCVCVCVCAGGLESGKKATYNDPGTNESQMTCNLHWPWQGSNTLMPKQREVITESSAIDQPRVDKKTQHTNNLRR